MRLSTNKENLLTIPEQRILSFGEGFSSMSFLIFNLRGTWQLRFLFIYLPCAGCRDYIHIMDLAVGHVAALKQILNPDFTGIKVREKIKFL
jgi:hypothetical protein